MPLGSRRVRAKALSLLPAALVVSLAGSGCLTKERLAEQLRTAMRQEMLPQVTACWEEELEAAGFKGEYLAVVDFTIQGGSGRIRDASVKEMIDTSGPDPQAAGDSGRRLRTCLEQALNASDLAQGGLRPGSDVLVRDFSLAFRDASSEARQAASELAPTILLGPRADRCKGLYTHDPPREAAVLFSELEEARAAVQTTADSPDAQAQALQKSYDVALELRDRLSLDSQREELPQASRERLYVALSKVDEQAAETAGKIGCQAPELDLRRIDTRKKD